MKPAACSSCAVMVRIRSRASYSASRKPMMPWPHTPKAYSTPSFARYSVIISAPRYRVTSSAPPPLARARSASAMRDCSRLCLSRDRKRTHLRPGHVASEASNHIALALPLWYGLLQQLPMHGFSAEQEATNGSCVPTPARALRAVTRDLVPDPDRLPRLG